MNDIQTIFNNQLQNVKQAVNLEGIAPYDMVYGLNTCYNFFNATLDETAKTIIADAYFSTTKYLANKVKATGKALTNDEITMLGMLSGMASK